MNSSTQQGKLDNETKNIMLVQEKYIYIYDTNKERIDRNNSTLAPLEIDYCILIVGLRLKSGHTFSGAARNRLRVGVSTGGEHSTVLYVHI